jgi:hypothetical protein
VYILNPERGEPRRSGGVPPRKKAHTARLNKQSDTPQELDNQGSWLYNWLGTKPYEGGKGSEPKCSCRIGGNSAGQARPIKASSTVMDSLLSGQMEDKWLAPLLLLIRASRLRSE